LIKSEWEKHEKAFSWTVTVPVNVTATIYIPAKSKTDVKENGNPAVGADGLEFIRMENGKAVFKAAPGNYTFSSVF
jgi:alpha-L-rhamnosidase